MNRSVTYADLREFLVGMGFEDQSSEYLVFRHPDHQGAALHMAFHEQDERLLERDLVRVRALLELSGLIERDEFDQWVRGQQARKTTA
jgi:hypothetical protein